VFGGGCDGDGGRGGWDVLQVQVGKEGGKGVVVKRFDWGFLLLIKRGIGCGSGCVCGLVLDLV
jgi:hypothetical protein